MNTCPAELYSNASVTSSAMASQLYSSSSCCLQLPAAGYYHHQQQQAQPTQQQRLEQQRLTDGIDASITFIHGLFGTDDVGAAEDADSMFDTAEFDDSLDLMHQLLGVTDGSDLAAAAAPAGAQGTSQQHGWVWPDKPYASAHDGRQLQPQQQEHGLLYEPCLVAETPAAWAAAAAAQNLNRNQQHQQHNHQPLQQQQQLMQPTVIPASWFSGSTTAAPAAGVAPIASGIATGSCVPTPEAPGLLFAAATGGSASSASTPALLPTLLTSPFMASASIGSGACSTPLVEEEASSSCPSNTDFTDALRRASAEQAMQQQTIGLGQQQHYLQHSWSAPHLAAATAAGVTAGGWWSGEAAAHSTSNNVTGTISSNLSAFDLSKAGITPCFSQQQQQQLLLAQELFLAQQQQQRSVQQQQLELLRSSELAEPPRRSLEARRPTDQISSKCSKLFRPRRPQVVPAAAPDLVISDRVRARMQWLHQQRHQQQRTARRQQQQQRTRLQPDEQK